MSREKVLSLLREHPNQSLSGEAMSRQLGVSRAAVWKAIEALRQEGYVISSAPNRGYCLQSAPDRVREGELAGPLAAVWWAVSWPAWMSSTPPTPSASAGPWWGPRRGWWCWQRSRPAAVAAWAGAFSPPGAADSICPPCCAPMRSPPPSPTSPPGWRWPCATASKLPAASVPGSSGPTTLCSTGASWWASSPSWAWRARPTACNIWSQASE